MWVRETAKLTDKLSVWCFEAGASRIVLAPGTLSEG